MLAQDSRQPPKVIPMKKLVATLLGVSFVSLLASCGGGTAQAPVDDSPEGQAFQYRRAVMQAVAYKVGQLRGIAQGEIAGDQATFVKHANDVAALGAMIPEGFIPNSAVEGSAALPEVWTNMADFQAKSMALANAAQALATAAQSNFESAKGMVQSVGGTCGDCHRPYRRRQEE
jgi:cytochrome c556